MKEVFLEIPEFDSNAPFCISMAGISYCDSGYKMCRKCSDTSLIEYVVSGCGSVEIGGKIHHIKAGDSYMLLESERHNYYSDPENPWTKIWINFHGRLSKSIIESHDLESGIFSDLNTKEYIERIHNILTDKSGTPRNILNDALLVFHELIMFISTNTTHHSTVSNDAKILKNYIDTNFYSTINNDILSKIIYKSPSQVIRIFKKHFGVTPYEYCLDIRIKKAKQFLSQTNLSVKEISFSLGFCDEHYFTNLFRKKVGMTPTAYRKSQNR